MRFSCTPSVFSFFCGFSLTFNAPVYQCVRLLIDYNIDIDSWYCWDFLSGIGPACPVDASSLSVVAIISLSQLSLLTMITSVNRLLYR